MKFQGRKNNLAGLIQFPHITQSPSLKIIWELKKTTTATVMGTSLNKRFNEENNGCARAL